MAGGENLAFGMQQFAEREKDAGRRIAFQQAQGKDSSGQRVSA